MNVPNLNFNAEGGSARLPAEGGSARLPATAAYGSRSVAQAPYGEFVNFNARDEQSDIRKWFFWYLGLALRYRWLILVCCAISLAIGSILTYSQTPIYQAAVTIQIDRQAARVVRVQGAEDEYSGSDDRRFYQTQYDLLRSRSLAERVAGDLDLAAASDFLNPPATSPWAKLRGLILRSANTQTATEGKHEAGNLQQRQTAAAGMVQSGLSVTPVPNSNLVLILFDSPSPEWAQRIANGVADSYVSSNLERRYGATAYARNFLKERLEELKLKLEESEKALVAYAQSQELIGDVKTNGGSQSLNDSNLVALN